MIRPIDTESSEILGLNDNGVAKQKQIHQQNDDLTLSLTSTNQDVQKVDNLSITPTHNRIKESEMSESNSSKRNDGGLQKDEEDEEFILQLLQTRQESQPPSISQEIIEPIRSEFFVYFHVSSTANESDNSSLKTTSSKHAETNPPPIKVTLDQLNQGATVLEAINYCIFQINNALAISKTGIRLIEDAKLFDMYIAKKNGYKKSFPAIYPLEKINKFRLTNLVLIPIDPSSIQFPTKMYTRQSQQIGQQTLLINGVPACTSVNNSTGEQKQIKVESRQSMLSLQSEEEKGETPKRSIEHQSFNMNKGTPVKKATSTFGSNDPEKQYHRRSIQSTISPKQPKSEAYYEEETNEDYKVITSSKCFPFSLCMKDSYTKVSSNSNSKKLSATLSSS